MKKVFRFFCTATSAAAILATVVSMSACNNHEHVWGGWQHDADGHWRVCTEEGCDAEDREAHSGTPCVYCGYGFKALSFGFTEGGDAAHADFAREANEWFAAQGEAEGFTYDFAGTDFSKLNDDTLENYDMVIFLNDRPSDPEQQAAFERFIKGGGAWIGFHSCAFSLVEDHWYSWFETFATLQSRLAVRLIVSFSQVRSEYMHLLKYRIDAFLQEPFEMNVLHEHLLRQNQEARESACWQNELHSQINTLLMQMMIPSHLNGFQYLCIACETAMETPTNRQIVMKHLYSMTARRCHTTAERVEKCIRTAVHAAQLPPFFLQVFHDDPTSRKVVMYVYACLKGIA